jgi:hypothetical protein
MTYPGWTRHAPKASCTCVLMPLRYAWLELDRGPLDIGFALAARDQGSPLPLETEDWTRVSPLDRLARCPAFTGSLDLPARAAAEDLRFARLRNDTPTFPCAQTAPVL